MQKVRRHSLCSRRKEFRLLIELLIQTISFVYNEFSPFPSQYYSLSLNLLYLALEDGSPIFRQVYSHRNLFKFIILLFF